MPKVFTFAMPHQERSTFLGSQQGQRCCVTNNRDGKSTFQLFYCGLHGCHQLKPLNQMLVGEVGDDLGVGVGLKNVAFSSQRLADFLVVFNNAVVNYAD